MVKPKPIIETEVRAQANNVRRLARSLRCQESWVEIRLRFGPGTGASPVPPTIAGSVSAHEAVRREEGICALLAPLPPSSLLNRHRHPPALGVADDVILVVELEIDLDPLDRAV